MADNEPISAKPIKTTLLDGAIFYTVEGGVGYQISKSDLKTIMAPTPAGVEFPRLHVAHNPASGVTGGTSVATVFTKRTLDTVFQNTITGASMAASVITLPAGTYEVTTRAPATDSQRHKTRWRNMTDGTTTADGSSEYSISTTLVSTNSFIHRARFTISATKTFELQHRVEVARAGDGFGVGNAFGEKELFAEVFIEKVA